MLSAPWGALIGARGPTWLPLPARHRTRVIDLGPRAEQLARVNHDTVPGESKLIALPLQWSEINYVEWKTAIPYQVRRSYDSP